MLGSNKSPNLLGHVFDLVDVVVAQAALVDAGLVAHVRDDGLLQFVEEVIDDMLAVELFGQAVVADRALGTELVPRRFGASTSSFELDLGTERRASF